MEHQIYRVIRRRTDSGIELRLDEHPKTKVKADSPDEAEESLFDIICAESGDGEPVLDYFDEPAEKPSDDWWCFSYNEDATTLSLPELYSGGVCKRCGVGLGVRKPTVTRKVLEKLTGDATYTWSGPISTHLVSEKMIATLIQIGLSSSNFAPVKDVRGKLWGEVLPRDPGVPWVPVKKHLGVKLGAQRCPKCGFSSFGFVHVEEKDIRSFIAESDVPAKGDAHIWGAQEPKTVFSTAGRDAIRKQKELRGFVWRRVGVAMPEDIETKLKFVAFPKQ